MATRVGTPFSGKREPFIKGQWKFTSEKNHILKSEEVEKLSAELSLPQLPEMTFGENKLIITHSSGFCIEFNAVDALKLVDPHNDLMKVAMAKEWKESRENSEYIAETVNPFDWTFTTNYQGTIYDPKTLLKISETDKRINIERLKAREKILFFDEMMLFEDELADNGCAQLTVKIRVMPSCFFLLMRFYLRVDGVLARIYDTRIYHEFESDYLIKEYSEKEKSLAELKHIPSSTLTDPNLLDRLLSVKHTLVQALNFSSDQKDTSRTFGANISPQTVDATKNNSSRFSGYTSNENSSSSKS